MNYPLRISFSGSRVLGVIQRTRFTNNIIPNSDITEEEYARNPVDAADGAFVAIDRIEKKEKQIDAAEQQREQEEQIRYTSENTRVENETLRINAEEQRERNEQVRIADEQRRINNEQSRESAEKIREETVATATQKADTASTNADQQAARAKSLADHPPKIVTVDDTNYWAFWDEATKDYITSSVRSDGGPIFATFDIDPAVKAFGCELPARLRPRFRVRTQG